VPAPFAAAPTGHRAANRDQRVPTPAIGRSRSTSRSGQIFRSSAWTMFGNMPLSAITCGHSGVLHEVGMTRLSRPCHMRNGVRSTALAPRAAESEVEQVPSAGTLADRGSDGLVQELQPGTSASCRSTHDAGALGLDSTRALRNASLGAVRP